MANYASLCPNCMTIKFTPWGSKTCPTCGTKMIQSRADQVQYGNMSKEKQYEAFKAVVPPTSEETLIINKMFEKEIAEQEEAVNAARAAAEQEAEYLKQRELALPNILISSGFNFEGYRIVKYSGYISGDDATTIPRVSGVFTSRHGQNLTDALVRIRIQALKELKEAAYDLGCNAVIGVDFDYLTLEPERASMLDSRTTIKEDYVICVTANGNAVVIEKI